MGADKIYDGDGDDHLFGEDLNLEDGSADRIFGGDGDDFLFGGTGNDQLFGGNGNGVMFLDAGKEMANGDAGDDIFVSQNGGTVIMTGGSGADQFVFDVTTTDHATIRDFTAAEDVFSLSFAQQQPNRTNLMP